MINSFKHWSLYEQMDMSGISVIRDGYVNRRMRNKFELCDWTEFVLVFGLMANVNDSID